MVLLLVPPFLIFNIVSLPLPARATSSCNGPCETLNNCVGPFAFSQNSRIATVFIFYENKDAEFVFSFFTGPARPTLNDFSEGGDGGGPSKCDEKYHSNSERVVALLTGWYGHGSRCGKMIRITASNGKSVTAKVVEKCQPPCKNNIVDGSSTAVWDGLGLDKNLGNVGITWSMA
ncbi:hypothetical protein RGQ29_001009 [Quercus rubra]|uniref:Kiwellin n=1 Tax=Quercus rubra TaxID=3512 RepID=A0AAN7JDL9_QUERU|nr:hypothetical protein RGQ29_001009 [Quercus rubra]